MRLIAVLGICVLFIGIFFLSQVDSGDKNTTMIQVITAGKRLGSADYSEVRINGIPCIIVEGRLIDSPGISCDWGVRGN